MIYHKRSNHRNNAWLHASLAAHPSQREALQEITAAPRERQKCVRSQADGTPRNCYYLVHNPRVSVSRGHLPTPDVCPLSIRGLASGTACVADYLTVTHCTPRGRAPFVFHFVSVWSPWLTDPRLFDEWWIWCDVHCRVYREMIRTMFIQCRLSL